MQKGVIQVNELTLYSAHWSSNFPAKATATIASNKNAHKPFILVISLAVNKNYWSLRINQLPFIAESNIKTSFFNAAKKTNMKGAKSKFTLQKMMRHAKKLTK